MGFGWMFLGYLLLLATNIGFFGVQVDVTPDVVGFLLMYKGFTVAGEHCDCFKPSRIFAMVGAPVSLLVAALGLAEGMELLSLPDGFMNILSSGYDMFKLAFTLVLLYGLYQISAQVEYHKTRKKAARCAVYTVILFFLAQFVGTVCSLLDIALDVSYAAGIAILADALCIVINGTLIFDCYRQICLEGDEDMPDNREHKYKTPFEYFERRRALDEAEKQKKYGNQNQHKKKK